MWRCFIWALVFTLTSCFRLKYRNGAFQKFLEMRFMKNDGLDKGNYRPLSVLPHMSKVFERTKYIQFESFMEDKLSNVLTRFRKNYSTQHCLINMFEQWKNTLWQRRFCLCHDHHGLIKGLWHDEPRITDYQVRSVWVSKKCTFFQEKLFNEKTATSSCQQ